MPGYLGTFAAREGSEFPKALYRHCREIMGWDPNVVYDVGAGSGDFLQPWLTNKPDVVLALDVSQDGLRPRMRHFWSHWDFVSRYDSGSNPPNVIICKSVLEHMLDQVQFLTRLKEMMPRRGVLFLMAPDWRTCSYEFWDDPTHLHPVTMASMKRLGSVVGLTMISAEYIKQTEGLLENRWEKMLAWVYAALVSQRVARWLEDRTGNNWFRFAKQRVVLGVFQKPVDA